MKKVLPFALVGALSAAAGITLGWSPPDRMTGSPAAPPGGIALDPPTPAETPQRETGPPARQWDIAAIGAIVDPVEREMATVDWANALAAEEFPAAMDAVLAGEVATRIFMQIALAERWLEVDPGGARLWLDGTGDGIGQHFAVEVLGALLDGSTDDPAVLFVTAVGDPQEAVRLLGPAMNKELWALVFGAAGHRIGDLMPLVHELPDVARRQFYRLWAKVDPRAATTGAAADGSSLPWNAVLMGIGESDPYEVLSVLGHPELAADRWQIEHALKAAADRCPLAVADWLRANPDLADSDRLVIALHYSMDGKAMVQLLDDLGIDHHEHMLATDPFAAIGHTAEHDYALADPEGFVELLHQRPSLVEIAVPSNNDPFATATDFNLSESAMALGGIGYAKEIFERLPEEMRLEFASEALSLTAPDDFDRAIAWARSLGDEDAQGRLLFAMSDIDHERALAFANATGLSLLYSFHSPYGAARTARWCLREGVPLEVEMVEEWAAADPPAAIAAAIGQLPEAIAPAMETWAYHEPRSASEFLRDSIPPGEARDTAIAGLVRVTRFSDPEAAEAWVAEVGDPEIRGDLEVLLTRPAFESSIPP